MRCPVCGANCVCRNRHPDGTCCSCHRHKVRKPMPMMTKMLEDETLKDFHASVKEHINWIIEGETIAQRKREKMRQRGLFT